MEKTMTTAVLMIPPYLQFFDNSGVVPLAGGLVYTYAAGTTTPLVTYIDATATTPAANPIVLDSAGRCQIWGVGSYKFIVKDSLGNPIGDTADNVISYTVPGNSGNPLFDIFSGDGSTTVFTLDQSAGTISKELLVWIDAGDGKGLNLQAPTAYTVSGTSLTFGSAPTSGTNNLYVVAPNILANAAAASASAAAGSASAASSSATAAASSASSASTSATTAGTNATNAGTSATASASSASAASTSATNSSTSATSSSTSATAAAGSATAAAASAAAAAGLSSSTSTTSLAIGTGSKTFTTQTGLNYGVGQFITAASNANSANYMHGTVTSYSGTALVVNVLDIGGSGTKTDWNIAVSGTQGPSTAAALLTGYVSGAGTVSATDTVLQGIQKLNGNIGALTGSELVLLSTATASASASLIFSSTYLTTAYSTYRLVFVDLLSSASSFKQVAFASDNATYTLAAQSTTETITPASSIAVSGTAQTSGPVKFTGTIAAAHCGVFDITIGAAVCTMSGTASDGGNSGDVRTTIMVNGGRVNALKLTPSSGNFTSGNVYLYGVKNS